MNNLWKNWDAARIVRLAAGIGFGIYAIVSKEYLFLLLAGFFLMQAVLNVSCCGAGGCSRSGKTAPERVYKDEIETYNPKKQREK